MAERAFHTRRRVSFLFSVAAYLAVVQGFPVRDAVAAAVSTIFDVRDFGASGGGITDDSAAITRAIDAAGDHGGMVLFPSGTYLVGTLQLRSNITLRLNAGATLQGSPDVSRYGGIAQFGFDHNYGVNSSGEGERVGVLVARNVHDVVIEGEGAIDGAGDAFFDPHTAHAGRDYDARYARNPAALAEDMSRTDDGPWELREPGRPGTMVLFSNVRNITFRGITLRNSPNWTLHLQHAQHVSASNIRIENNAHLPNNDGFDCMDCHDVRLSDSFFEAGDDDFAFVGSSDLTVSNCVLNSYSAAIRLEDSRDATFSDLVMHANRGIAVFAREGTHTRNIVFHHIVIDTHLRHGHWWGKAEPIFIASSTSAANNAGVRNVEFSDIVAESEGGIVLDATRPGAVSEIYLRNVRLGMRNPPVELSASQGGNFDLRWTATSLDQALFAHAIPALYSRNVGTLTLDGFSVTWPEAPRDYFSSALDIRDFNSVDINAVRASQATGSEAAAIHLLRGSTVALRNSTAAKGTRRFLQMDEVPGPIFTSGNDLSREERIGLPAKQRSRSHP